MYYKNTLALSKEATLKIDTLIEEANILSAAQNKIQEFVAAIDKKLSTKGEIERLAKAEEAAQKRREKFLKDNDVDIDKFKNLLKEGKDIKVSFKQIFGELKADLKQAPNIETAKMILGMAIMFIIGLIVIDAMKKIIPDINLVYALTTLIMSPLAEELFKRIGISKRQSAQTFIIFNLTEGILNFSSGIPLWVALFYRLRAVAGHLLYTMQHVKGKVLDDYKKDLKITTSDKNEYKNKSSIIAMSIHALNNYGLLALSDILSVFSLMTGDKVLKAKVAKKLPKAKQEIQNMPSLKLA